MYGEKGAWSSMRREKRKARDREKEEVGEIRKVILVSDKLRIWEEESGTVRNWNNNMRLLLISWGQEREEKVFFLTFFSFVFYFLSP